MPVEDIKSVLVTGGNGFVGSRICRMLAAHGYKIHIVCRKTSDLSLLEGIPVGKHYADVTSADGLAEAVTGRDYIIHSAGLIRARRESDFFRVNQQGTINMLNAVKNNNLAVKKFVLISSVAAAGPSNGEPRTEEHEPHPISAYGRSKLAGEEALQSYFDLFPITVIRPPAVYGPGDRAVYSFFDLANRRILPQLAGGNNRVQMVYADDLALGIMQAMESEHTVGNRYFIAEQEAYSLRELTAIISSAVGKKGVSLPLPKWILVICAIVAEFWFKALGKAPLFSRQKLRELTASWELDVSAAQKDFGFVAPTDFPTGAAATVSWYRNAGWLS
jgi:nucleoside-diphosphate-sugar epimerase